MISERSSQRAFFAISALLFAASAAVTIVGPGVLIVVAPSSVPGLTPPM